MWKRKINFGIKINNGRTPMYYPRFICVVWVTSEFGFWINAQDWKIFYSSTLKIITYGLRQIWIPSSITRELLWGRGMKIVKTPTIKKHWMDKMGQTCKLSCFDRREKDRDKPSIGPPI
ncbi:hypothetical protein RIR_jg30041.t1 [Rhizophagus irregularis DAOM 181602=DAOM 197198]|nr:hypothetical protein RIR_jg30041.t1 [Rhizophagus irregularis DAOM 181602=DAOM 197198]